MGERYSLPSPPYPYPRLAIYQTPVVIELKPSVTPVRKRQYPLSLEAQVGILPHISRLKQTGILIDCQSAWSTLILPIKKEGGQGYRLVQDLRLVNQATMTLHPTIPNPYTLLSLLPPSAKIYTCLDLKDAFLLYRKPGPFLLLNGKTQQRAPNNSSPGLNFHKDLRIPQPSLGKLLTWTHSSQRSSAAGCYNMWMTRFWLLRMEKTAGKRPRLY